MYERGGTEGRGGEEEEGMARDRLIVYPLIYKEGRWL